MDGELTVDCGGKAVYSAVPGLVVCSSKDDLLAEKFYPMAAAGYSGTPLLQKLGIKPGTKLMLINQPDEYDALLEKDVNAQLCKKNEVPDLVHLFVRSFKDLESAMEKLKPLCRENTSLIIWVSWYKRSAKKATDVTEDIIRNYALSNDLVDVKVCSVSEQWSGLKLVVPLLKR